MKRIKSIQDEDVKFEVEVGDKVITDDVTEMMVLWDEVRFIPKNGSKPDSLQDRYDAFRSALSKRWGADVSQSTAFLVLELAFAGVASLKKTLFGGPNSKSLESKQTESQVPN